MATKKLWHLTHVITLILFVLVLIALNGQAQNPSDQGVKTGSMFPRGEKANPNNFTGNVWMKVFVANDSTFGYHLANVTFEPGARTYWHKHPGGQVLLAIEGIGYYQEKGKAIQILRPGDTVKCPPDTEHWHGASPKTEFSHIGITNNTPKGIAIWLKMVTDEEYNSVK
jgi:quercetin dioxygenase-like cupin family protein